MNTLKVVHQRVIKINNLKVMIAYAKLLIQLLVFTMLIKVQIFGISICQDIKTEIDRDKKWITA
jgi:hypothetical protein